jgi:hypothetical protein
MLMRDCDGSSGGASRMDVDEAKGVCIGFREKFE